MSEEVEMGFEEGDVCNRNGCDGIMEIRPVENCSCHVSPPCTNCVENNPICNKCGES